MYLNVVSHYLPEEEVNNSYFLNVNGLSDEWIFQRTGIRNRRRARKSENATTMGLEAVRNALSSLPYPIEDVDLIISASYTPYDTIGTLAHVVQRKYSIKKAAAVAITSACSSLVNAVEIVEGYFALKKATKALVIVSEHNTAYSDETDKSSGHLWGDGSAALFFSAERYSESDIEVLEVTTSGLGHIGRGPDGIMLHPRTQGIIMPHGRDVFANACVYMESSLRQVLENQNANIEDLAYLIPHQANMRIISQLSKTLNFSKNKILTNIEDLGNTGCASTAIALSQNRKLLKKNDLVGITVFGGGYSSGALLLRC